MSGHLIARLVHAIWLGSGLFLIAVAAPAAFRGAPNATIAADIVGVMLSRWHYIGLGAPLLLLFLDWRRGRVHVLAVVLVAILFAAAQAATDLRIRAVRAQSPVPISELSREDPVRRHFGRLHGISSLLLLMQVIAAGVALAMDREAYPTPSAAVRAMMQSETNL
ncbi:MAG TPA: DUF4149 domain-containing protein [Thermoanaerobaculia bacterium]|jgi:hypothetical protein|nr:DUF4149 domain-containing protein [Thermoanaerobaculia bacterium]